MQVLSVVLPWILAIVRSLAASLHGWSQNVNLLGQFSGAFEHVFGAFEIDEKLRKAFDANGLKDTRFEFAIASSVNLFSYEIKSKNFLNVVDDTVLNRTFIYLLPVPSGSDCCRDTAVPLPPVPPCCETAPRVLRPI